MLALIPLGLLSASVLRLQKRWLFCFDKFLLEQRLYEWA